MKDWTRLQNENFKKWEKFENEWTIEHANKMRNERVREKMKLNERLNKHTKWEMKKMREKIDNEYENRIKLTQHELLCYYWTNWIPFVLELSLDLLVGCHRIVS